MTLRRRSILAIAVVTATTAGLTGCAKHYRYTDLQTERAFYAKGGKVNNERGGAVTFTDGATGRKVTLQSFERERITKSEYKDATRGG